MLCDCLQGLGFIVFVNIFILFNTAQCPTNQVLQNKDNSGTYREK